MTYGLDPADEASRRASPRRGPRVVDVVLMAILPFLIFMIDLEAVHRAGPPRHRLARLRAYLSRGIRPRR